MLTAFNQLPANVRRNFCWDFSAAAACGVFFGAINPFVLVQATRIGCSPFVISILAAAPFIGMILASVLASKVQLHHPVRSVYIWDGLARLVLLLLAVFSSRIGFTLVFIIYYLLSSISQPAYATAMGVVYPDRVRGQMMGAVRVGFSITAILSALAGGVFLPLWGPYVFFAISAIFGLLSAFCFSRIHELTTLHRSAGRLERGEAFQVFRCDRGYRRYMTGLMIYGFSNLMALPVYVLFQVNQLKVSDDFISKMAFLTSITLLIIYYLVGKHMDRKGPLYMGVFFIGLNALVPITYLLTHSLWPLWIIAVLSGVLNAGLDLSALGNSIYFANGRKIAAYNAVHITLLGIRGTIAPLLGPLLAGVLHYQGFFILVAVLNLIGLWVAFSSVKIGPGCIDGLANPGLTTMTNSVNLRE